MSSHGISNEYFRFLMALAPFALNLVVQSSVVLVMGLWAARLLRGRGPAVQSAALRATLIAVIACPLVSWLLHAAGLPALRLGLPESVNFDSGASIAADSGSHETSAPSAAIDVPRVVSSDRHIVAIRSGSDRLDGSTPSIHQSTVEPKAARDALSPIATWEASRPARSAASHSRIGTIITSPAGFLAATFVWCVTAWLLIALVLILRLALAIFMLSLTRRAARAAGADLEAACASAARALSVSAPPLLVSRGVNSPCLAGCRRAAILLPANTQLIARDVLLHELAHLRRNDCPWHLLGRLTAALLWFHPLAWLLSRRLEQTADEACDDYVVTHGGDRAGYARCLVDLAERMQAQLLLGRSGVGIIPFRSMVGRRIARILDASRSVRLNAGRRALLFVSLAAAAATLAAGSLGTGATEKRSPAPQATATSPASAPAESAKTELRLKVVNAQTGAVVPGMHGEYWLDDQNGNGNKQFTCDPLGEYRIPLKPGTRTLSFFYQKDNFVQGMLIFGGEFGIGPIPATYTLRLQPGIVVGGTVNDQHGKGVGGAKVQLTFTIPAPGSPNGSTFAYGSGDTGPDGRWTFTGAPKDMTNVQVFTKHPDFVLSSFNHSFGPDGFESLRKQTLITVIQRGVTVSGTVVDSEGKPVPHAYIAPDSFGMISETQANERGEFQLHGVEPGARHLAAKADGYAPALQDVVVADGMKPLEFRLEKGHVMRGRVVDAHGKPTPDVYIVAGKWRTMPRLGAFFKTDADGQFVWKGAPADAVMLAAKARNFPQTLEVSCTAGEKEIVLAFPRTLILRGTAVDNQSGKSIDRFTVHVDIRQGRTGMSMDRAGADGKYEVGALPEGESYGVRINASGYLPAEAPALQPKGDVIDFDARLNRGGGAAGIVLQPDGKPAAGADVLLLEGGGPTVENGVLTSWAKTANPAVTTNAAGQFMLPPRKDKVHVFVFHDSGWAELERPASALGNITLRPWCRVEGRLMKAGKPWAGQTVWLEPVSFTNDEFGTRRAFQYHVTSDTDGRFAIDRVVDGPAAIGVQLVTKMGDGRESFQQSHGVPLELKPGERKLDVQIGGTGRPVVARVIVPEELKARGWIPSYGSLQLACPQFVPPTDYASLSTDNKRQLHKAFEQTDEYLKYARRVKSFAAPLAADGSLRFEDVPAGQYQLLVDVQQPTPEEPNNYRWVATGQTTVDVPDMPGGRSTQPLDAGTIELKEHHYLKPGDAAPAFEAQTFDGGHFKLSDYKGKYVLLDFWATWCGPCIAELKNLEKVHDTFARDNRLVMINISVDDRIDEPAHFLRTRKLPWRQGFAGSITGAPGQAFGIQAIPSIWLIGPDGRIIANDLQGDAIEATLRSALHPPAAG